MTPGGATRNVPLPEGTKIQGGSSRTLTLRMLSVVIPTLNEGGHIERTLTALPFDGSAVEVLVVDGGSVDDTCEIARRYAVVIHAPRGRARQMNAGAEVSRGDTLLFLHADTVLPPGAFGAIRHALQEAHTEAGAFRLRFEPETRLLHFYSSCSRLPWTRICFGDRALFVRRPVFDDLGGFPDIPIFEDLEMVRRLHERGGFRFMRPAVTTSARRFLHAGPLRQQMLNARLWVHYVLGKDPHRVAHRYRYDL